ncbi:MAG TPA: ATP-binding protein, partial [Vicinamibacterales bacterium]|nr:ATP-binding protein [Vicinamibacterales bacterium]
AYHSLVEHASLGILRSTVDGRILEANHALAAMLGYASPEEVAALPGMLTLWANPAARAGIVERLKREGRINGLDIVWKRRDGAPFRAHVNARAVHGADGVVRSIEMMVEDVTDRLRAEEERRRVQTLDAVGQLAAGVAHHFNNLLTGMLGYTELLASQDGVSEEMRSDLNEILKAGRRASVLTQQLLTFSDPRESRPENLDLNDVAHAQYERLSNELRANQTLAIEAWSGAPIVRLDPEELHLVLTHLVRNARDAMPEGGGVRIEIRDVADPEPGIRGDYVRLRVTDTGVGMDWETQSRMFEPFFTTKPQDEGMGLGLSVAHGIVRNCGGIITVDSALGKGTTMNVYFPRP